MAIDLGVKRYINPTCYTIRNRMSSSYVMLNWLFEGSVDGKKWFIFDKRLYQTEDESYNNMVKEERQILKRRGGSSTWGVDRKQIMKINETFLKNYNRQFEGVRFFRIT